MSLTDSTTELVDRAIRAIDDSRRLIARTRTLCESTQARIGGALPTARVQVVAGSSATPIVESSG